jgi:hypothetical protein
MWAGQIHTSPSASLVGYLREDAAGHRGGLLARVLDWMQGEDESSHLYTLIETGRVPEKERPQIMDRLNAYKAHFLLPEDPRYEQMKEHGPMLVAHPEGNAALLSAFGRCNSNIVSGWLLSKLEAQPLAVHLRHAMRARGPDRKGYLMRWYDPFIAPTLLRLGNPVWLQWLLGPITGWWYPVDTPRQETWSRVTGGNETTAPVPVPPLRISEELWEALVSDPLPYSLLNYAEKAFPCAFESDCYGVRLAKIEDMLSMARQQGLREQEDLMVYVLSLLEVPSRSREEHWQTSVQRASTGQAPLTAYYSD